MKILGFIRIVATIFLFYHWKTSLARDTIIPNQGLLDNNSGDTLVSSGEAFELGFFSPHASKNRYVGIWFKKNVTETTVVWVANRDKPLTDFSGILKITSTGNAVILNNVSSIPLWYSNASTILRNPTLKLLDTGNLVVQDGDGSSYIWQSFDHPCDTMISGMRLGVNLKTGQRWVLNSWKSLQDPSTGDYSYEVDAKGLPQLNLVKGTNAIKYRSGPWDGLRFGDLPEERPNMVNHPIFVFNSTDVFYSFEKHDAVISRLVVTESGYVKYFIWRKEGWNDIYHLVRDQCDEYGTCSSNGICKPSLLDVCQCLPGHTPINKNDWHIKAWEEGCKKTRQLNCSEAVGFTKLSNIKLPDKSHILRGDITMDLNKCRDTCLRNCSCVAYAQTKASACIVWFGDMLDTKQYNTLGQDLYIKVAASELESNSWKRTAIIVSVSVTIGILLLALVGYHVHKRRTFKRNSDLKESQIEGLNQDFLANAEEEDLDLPIFDLETIANATGNFSSAAKLGEGGFGSVYKGKLPTGQDIAVKRLAKDSGQGVEEFKNEVLLISKLQHRNLVRLLGCCICGDEKMLIYEYMPNGSLDFYIFDPDKDKSLGWRKRFEIIVGIARGLLYLHRDSRLRIIHRDLKASNILLDGDMNPKISDFGLARIFGGDQTEASTMRIMGTYGYMSPEYAIEGLFSTKSDVFSFGVLVLEIVNGKKNRGFSHPDHDLNLLGHAWNLWNQGRPLELVDHATKEPLSIAEQLRCIQVGLLSVQQRPEDRPTMSSVLLMLDSESSTLPHPKQPGFYTERFHVDKDSSSTGATLYTSNEVTMTKPQGR